MIIYDRIRCADGIVRYPRVIVKKVRRLKPSLEIQVDKELEDFDQLYKKISEEYYFGLNLNFHSKGFKSAIKKKLIEKILQMLKDQDIEVEIYVRAQFEAAKEYPRSILSFNMASDSALKTYSNFIKKFPNSKSAKDSFKNFDLQEMLEKSHERFLHLKNQLKLPESVIYKLRWKDFNPFYLISIPELVDLFYKKPEELDSQCLAVMRHVFLMLQKNPKKAQKFWELARSVKFGKGSNEI